MCKFIFCLAFFFGAASYAQELPAVSQGITDPSISWEVLETPHFHLLFDSRHYWLAQRYAAFSEQAFLALQPIFKEYPEKTTLVLNDNTDLANGYATQFPYPMIMANPVLPQELDSISDYGDWGLELVTHEYTHILNMQPTHGAAVPLRWIFGSLIRPNSLLPRWYLEGLAVNMETRYSNFGRLRSPNFQAVARAMVEEKTLRKEDISRVNETDIPDWPGGMRPYLIGSMLMNELIRKGGDKAIYELNQRYSRRVPSFINSPLKDLLGLNYEELLSATYNRIEKQSGAQITKVDKADTQPYEVFSQEGYFSHSPAISPDGTKLIYVARTHNRNSLLKLVVRRNKESFARLKTQTLSEWETEVQKLSWFPDSKSFVYDKVEIFSHFYIYADLYRYDIDHKKSNRLTHGLRAREPVVAPDGKQITFIQNTDVGTRLVAVQSDGSNLTVLYTPRPQTRLSSPEYLSSTELIFAERTSQGKEHFRTLNLKSKSSNIVLEEFAPVHFPRMTKEGLLFVSDKSGIANFYLQNKKGEVRAITNTTTRAMTGELDPLNGELIYSRLMGQGPLLVKTLPADWQRTPAALPQVGPLVDYEWPEYTPPDVKFAAERKNYSVWPYMLPRYWLPGVYVNSQGLYLSATTSAADPLGLHSYSLTTAYDTFVQRPGFFASYVNQTTLFPITVVGDDYYTALGGGAHLHNIDLATTIAYYLPGLYKNMQAGLGWIYAQTDAGLSPLVRNGPQVFLNYVGTTQRGQEISPESGANLKVSDTEYISNLGNLGYNRIDFHGSTFFSKSFAPLKWLPERHVLALFLDAVEEPGLPFNDFSLGPSSLSGSYIDTGYVSNRYVMRGYDTGTFIGRNVFDASAEYRFPISYSYSGFGTRPLFISRWYGDVFSDITTLDGAFYNAVNGYYQRARLGKFFVGTGAEIKADTTLFYQLPITFSFGLYYGLNTQASNGQILPYFSFTGL